MSLEIYVLWTNCFQFFAPVEKCFLCHNRAVRLLVITLALMSIKNRLTERRWGDLRDVTRPHRCEVMDLAKRESAHRVTRRRRGPVFRREGSLMLGRWAVNTSTRIPFPRHSPSRPASDPRGSSFPNLTNLRQTGGSFPFSSSAP